MRHTNRIEKLNHEHLTNVIIQRRKYKEAQEAQYTQRAVRQAMAQINRPSRDVADNVNRNFAKRFLEAL